MGTLTPTAPHLKSGQISEESPKNDPPETENLLSRLEND